MAVVFRNLLCGVILPLCLIALGIFVGIILIDQGIDNSVQSEKEHILTTGQLVSKELATAMSGSLNTAWTLAGFVIGEDTPVINHTAARKEDRMIPVDGDKLYKLGTLLTERFPSVGSLQIQPSAVVTQAYPPLTPGVPPWGHDLYNDVDRRQDIIAGITARSLMVAGPFPLVQGGIGLLSRYPVFKVPPEIPISQFVNMSLEESLQYWWGMTASLVLVEVLIHEQIKITEVLKEGEIDYCLEYFNLNTKSVVVVHSQTNALNVTLANTGGISLRNALQSQKFEIVPIDLPGGRQWNLWLRKSSSDNNRDFKLIICVAISMIGAIIVSSVYWGPYIARNRLYSVLIEIFEEIMEMNIQSVDQRLPNDSPSEFVYRMQQMLDALVVYRSFLPQSITACDTQESEETKTNSERKNQDNSSEQAATMSAFKSIESNSENRSRTSTLAFSCGLFAKDGSIVVIEAVDHMFMRDENLENEHFKFMQVVLDSLKQHRNGKIYSVTGGLITVEFNCSKPVASHALSSVSLLQEVTSASLAYRAGVSVGRLSCGILGSSAMMSFVICGRAVEEAHLLARYAASLTIGRGIICERAKVFAEGRVVCAPIDLVYYQTTCIVCVPPHRSIGVLYVPMSVCEQQNEEWMYFLANNDDRMLQPYNLLWKQCILEKQPFCLPEELKHMNNTELQLLIERLAEKCRVLPNGFTHTVTLGMMHYHADRSEVNKSKG